MNPQSRNSIKDKNGNLKAVKIVKLKQEKDPKTGRMNMKEIPDTEQILDADIVLIAAGFTGKPKIYYRRI